MYVGQDFDPSDPLETELYGFDFAYDVAALYPSENLLTAVFDIGVFSGTDLTPLSHLIGQPFVMVNPANNIPLVTLAVQQVSGLLPGLTYWLRATVTTDQGNTLSLWSRVSVAAPPIPLRRYANAAA